MPSKSQAATFREANKAISILKEIAAAILIGDFSKYSVADFNARFTKLDAHRNKLETVFHKILDEDDIPEKLETSYTEQYEQACLDYDTVLVAHEKIHSKSLDVCSATKTSAPASVLPKIELPKFSSKIEDWPSFIAIFKSLTDDMTSLTDAVKLHYLLSSLTGEALSLVAHLKITNENYTIALEILKKRYENRRVLIDRFVDIILGLPTINARSDIRAHFITPLISAQSALNNLELPMRECDYIFVSILVRKLKGELRSLFERRYGNISGLPTLQNLISFLEEHARCVETEWSNPQLNQPIRNAPCRAPNNYSAPQHSAHQQDISRRQFTRDIRQPPRPVYSAQLSATNRIVYCPYCKTKDHRLMLCPQYLDLPIQRRWDFISSRNRCHRCLGPHYENQCSSRGACRCCNDTNHHSTLCRSNSSDRTHQLPLPQRMQPHQHLADRPQHKAHTSRFRPESPLAPIATQATQSASPPRLSPIRMGAARQTSSRRESDPDQRQD